MTEALYSACGKQVLMAGVHFADAATPEIAASIAGIFNGMGCLTGCIQMKVALDRISILLSPWGGEKTCPQGLAFDEAQRALRAVKEAQQ